MRRRASESERAYQNHTEIISATGQRSASRNVNLVLWKGGVCLELNMPDEAVEAALDQVAQQSSELRATVAAVREPQSEAGHLRRELLEDLAS
jgi:hypothetical protein